MDIATFRNIADFGMDDPLFFQQWQVDPIDDFNSISCAFSQGLHHSYAAQQPLPDFKRPAEASPGSESRPWKQLKGSNWSSCKQERMSNSPPPTNSPKDETWFFPTDHQTSNYVLKPCQGIKRVTPNTKLSQPQDHILAERKRREKLTQSFIALSALIPGLKKMDKASVLGDAIKYMKQLQEKVKVLEEKAKKKTVESVVLSGRGRRRAEVCESLPEIEAKICGKDVLISIHCEKRKGILEKTVAEIEKIHLSVVNSSVVTFGDSALTINITIIAKMDGESGLNMKELIKNLRGAIRI